MKQSKFTSKECQGNHDQKIQLTWRQYTNKLIILCLLTVFSVSAGIISTPVHGATVSAAGEILTINLDTANDAVTLVSNGSTYTFTLTSGSWTGSPWPLGISVSGTVLTVDATGLSTYNTFNVNNSATSPSGNAVTFGNSGANVYSDNINVLLINSPGQVSFNGTSSFSGSNSISVVTEKNILFETGSGLTTEDGDITLEANQQATATSGTFVGITVNNATLQITGTGTMNLKGRGGNTGESQHGFQVLLGGKVIGGTTGLLCIEGYGGETNNNNNYGVSVGGGTSPNFSTITSNGGNVLVKGVGGGLASSSSSRNMGILIGEFGSSTGAGMITSGGSGTVTLDGTGGVGDTGSLYFGISISGNNAMVLSGGTGSVNVTGTGGMSANAPSPYQTDALNHGVLLDYSGTITTGTNGSVSVTGTGGCNGKPRGHNCGIYLNRGSKITSQGSAGSVTVNGTGGYSTSSSNYGVYVTGGTSPNFSTITSGGGNVSVTGTGGGSGTSAANYGVFLNQSGIITSGSDGSVSVAGNGGCSDGTGRDNFGVYLDNNGKITSGGAGNVTVTGIGGNSSGSENFGVLIKGGTGPEFSTITSGGGNVTVTGTGRGTGTSTNQYGVFVGGYSNKGVITSGGTGSVKVIGTASNGTTGTDNIGVLIIGADAKILSGGSGTVSVTGTGGGTGNSGFNHGITIFSGTITSGTNGSVYVTGQGGCDGGTGSNNSGIGMYGGKITSSGTQGTVTVMGTGSNSSGSSNFGVLVNGGTAPAFATISSGGGNVIITGMGGGTGSSSENYGVWLGSSVATGRCLVSAGGMGSLTINGQGGVATGTSNFGVYIGGANAKVLSAGNITITGTEGGSTNGYALKMIASGSVSSTGTGSSVTLNGNSIDLAAGTSVSAPDGYVNILPRTAGVNIDLGSGTLNTNGPLTFTNTAFGLLSGETVTFGGSVTNTINISQNLTVSAGSSLKLATNETGGVIPLAIADFSMEGETLTFGAGTPLRIAINGTTVNTNYNQLTVNGAVNLAGAGLSLSGTYTSQNGDVFTIVSATGITGTFSGLPDDTEIIFNTKKLRINYTTTSVTLTSVVECANPTDGGEIETDQTICSGTAPAGLTNKTTPTGHTGTLEYKWQFSTTSASADFEDINPAAIEANYSPGALTTTTWFKRLVKVECEETWLESNVVEINVIEPSKRYVTVSGAGSKNGLDWSNAYDGTQLQAAINESCVNEVWVAAGTYTPTLSLDQQLPKGATKRQNHFWLKNKVAVYGGFAGTETSLTERVIKDNPTILSGDINGDDNYSEYPGTYLEDNVTNVIYLPEGLNLNNTAILDGFIIQGGMADQGGLGNPDGNGGGMFCFNNSPLISNCVFRYNHAVLGGAISVFANNSDIVFINCIVSKNKSLNGGGFFVLSESLTLTNTTITDNFAEFGGGGIYALLSYITLNNSVIWGNNAGEVSNQISNQIMLMPGGKSGSKLVMNYSCYSNGENDIVNYDDVWEIDFNNCITENPMFVNPLDGDYRIDGTSPCVDKGNDTYNDLLTDIRGAGFNRKIPNSNATFSIDMGAYEYNSHYDPGSLCTNPTDGGTIADDQTICSNTTPEPLTQTIAPEGTPVGILEYKWQSSEDGSTFYDIDPAVTSEGYSPPALTTTTWFKRLVKVDCETDWLESNTIQIEVDDPPTASINFSLIYNNGGFVTHPGAGVGGADVSMASIDPYNVTGSNALKSEPEQYFRIADDFHVNGTLMVQEIITFAYQTAHSSPTWTSFNMNIWDGRPGDAGSNIIASSTSATIEFSGVYRVFNGAGNLWNTQRAIQKITWDLAGLEITAGTYWIDWQIVGGSSAWANWVMEPNPSEPLNPITITGNARQLTLKGWQYIRSPNIPETPFIMQAGVCLNDDITISGATASNGTIEWTHDGLGDLTNKNTLAPTYTPHPDDEGKDVVLTMTVTGSSFCDPATASLTLQVRACCSNPTNGGEIEEDQTICSNTTPEPLTQTIAPEGTPVGILEYKWQSSEDGSTFYDIDPAVTSEGYSPPALTSTTWFKRLVKVDCESDWLESNVVEITVEPTPVPGTLAKTPDVLNVCEDADVSAVLTAGSGGNGIDSLAYRTYNGTEWSSWAAYTSGTDISTSGKTEVEVRTWRTATYCDNSDTTTVSWSTSPQPIANAGVNATITEFDTYTLSTASAQHYTSVNWATDGDGTFSNINGLKPVYTPGSSDLAGTGMVELCLTAQPETPCTVADEDCMTLRICRCPSVVIVSPTQKEVLYGNPVTVSGTSSDPDNNVDYIEVRLNGGLWQTATGTTNWTIDFDLLPGRNTLEARATDLTDLQSGIEEVEVTLSIQVIEIPQGWSYISSYLEPADPNIVNMWDEIVGANNLMILTGVNGIYAPAPFFINTLHNWDYTKGYKVKMHQADELVLVGDTLADKSITFGAGTHIIPVLTDHNVVLEDVIENPQTKVNYMLDLSGNKVFWPAGGVFTLTELEPGKGYLANFSLQTTIEYPDMTNNDFKSKPFSTPAPGPWQITRTGNVHLISVSAQAIANLQNADYIGAFDNNGNCVGYAETSGATGNVLLTVYGDDLMTQETDGLIEGETISLRAFRNSSNEKTPLEVEWNQAFANADGLFANEGLSQITSLKTSATGLGENLLSASVQVYPNPANDMLNITLTHFDSGSLTGLKGTIISAEGKLIKTFSLTEKSTKVAISDLQAGVYLLRIEAAENVVIKRIVVQ